MARRPAAGGTRQSLWRIATWPIRMQLLALALAAIVPLAAVGAYSLYAAYRQSLQHAEATAQTLAGETAERVTGMLARSRAALERVAAHEAVDALQGAACSPVFAEFSALFPVHRGLTLRARSGEIVCNSSRYVTAAQAVHDEPWFRDGLAAGRFRVGGAYFGKLSGRWITLATVPVRDPRSDAVTGLLVVSMDLARLGARLLPYTPAGAVINIIDRNGRFVLRNLEAEQYLGVDTTRSELARLLPPGVAGAIRVRGIDEVARIYAVRAIPGTDWRVATGLSEDGVLAAHRARLAFSAILALAGLVLALAVARSVSRAIEAPVRALSRAAGIPARTGSEIALARGELERRAEALLESEARLRGMVDAAMDAIITIDEAQRIVQFNPAAERLFGLARERALGAPIEQLMPHRARAAHAEHVRRFGASDVSARRMDPPGTAHALRADGSECPVEATISQHVAQGRKLYTAIVRDISERVASERFITRQNDFYAALSRTNRAIVQATDPQRLMQEICRICVEHGHATIAHIAQVQGTTLVPMAWAGPAEEFLADIPLLLDPELPEGDGPIARAVRSGVPYVANDFLGDPCTRPWRERAAPIGTRSTAAVPYRRAGSVAGALSLHMSHAEFFDHKMVALLEEMTDDLSFALDAIDRQGVERAARDRFEKIFNAAPVAANISALADGRVLASNDAACRFFGYPRETFTGRTALELGIWEDPVQRDALLARLRAEQRVTDFDARFRLRSGEVRDVQIAAETIEFDDEQSMLIITSDVTERRRYEAHITHLANYDELTGLPNRNLARDRIEQAIAHAGRIERLVGLVYLDLDRFKVLNDGFGHAFGDALLAAAGERLSTLVREGDTVARFGGDEFIIVLADARRLADMFVVVQKLLDAFEKPFTLQGREVHVNFSVGISVYPHDGKDFTTLIGNADVAMYRAKALGRGTYQFFTASMGEESQQRVALETRLRHAIAAGEMSLVYQPRVHLETGRIIGCEALLRWMDPAMGPVSPAQFIPAAEDSGLIVPLGDWVLRTACAQARAWRDAGLPDLVMSVNVSVRQFLQPDVTAWVLDALRTSGLAPQWLELELTESLIASDTAKVIRTIDQLEPEGVKFSIDDFGTGYSSFAYLKRFRVDTLKIDQSFIRDMLADPDDEAIVLAVIGLAHSLRMRATAEGVETAEHVRVLREHGCDEMQGYFFSKPVPAADFEAMLRSGKRLA